MDKFQDKYRISSARLQNWDYGSNASYFVTICTGNRECYFGSIMDGEMKLSETGKYAYDCWMKIPDHFPFVRLDEFIVMPNHVHGIIVIDKQNDVPTNGQSVETQNFASLQPAQSEQIIPAKSSSRSKNTFGPQSQNLASIVRGFKTAVTIYARKTNADFAWQSRFYDHITGITIHIKEYGDISSIIQEIGTRIIFIHDSIEKCRTKVSA